MFTDRSNKGGKTQRNSKLKELEKKVFELGKERNYLLKMIEREDKISKKSG